MDNIVGVKSRLTWAVNITVIALVLLWTIPTFGLLVSSFRDRDQVTTSGWWSSMFANEAFRCAPRPPVMLLQKTANG